MKILALDLGDVWTGTALSDALKILAKPYQTIKTEQLINSLQTILMQEKIDTILIGYPRTMKNTHSAQTEKVLQQKEIITQTFPHIKIVLWDERLSSKTAQSIQSKKSRMNNAQHEHSIAAAVILQTYLQFLGQSFIS